MPLNVLTADPPFDLEAVGRKPRVKRIGKLTIQVWVIVSHYAAQPLDVERHIPRQQRINRPDRELELLGDQGLALGFFKRNRQTVSPILRKDGKHMRTMQIRRAHPLSALIASAAQ